MPIQVKDIDNMVIELDQYIRDYIPSIKLSYSLGYVIWVEDGVIYVKDSDGKVSSGYNETSLQSLFDNASGLIYFRPGDYGGISLTGNSNIRIILENGVLNLTINPPSTGVFTVEDYSNNVITHYKDGSILVQIDLGTPKIDLQGELDLNSLVMRGDIDLGGNSLKTTNLLIREATSTILYLRDILDSNFRDLALRDLYVTSGGAIRVNNGYLQTYTGATVTLEIRSHDGSAYVTNLKLIDGTVEIYGGKLVSDLNVGGYALINTSEISTQSGAFRLDINVRRPSTSAGVGFRILSYNASDILAERLVLYSGYNIVDMLIRNANLKPDVANNGAIGIEPYVDDYGGAFANFTPPTGFEGRIIVAIDTNATTPGKRLYVYANGAWNYVDLS